MPEIRFEWDSSKNDLNQKKHGVSFEEGKTVFYDENARLISDPEHSDEEDRFIMMGMSLKLRILIVCHCYRENENAIRIISARKTSKQEADQYRRYK